jgi:carbonic anhydrase
VIEQAYNLCKTTIIQNAWMERQDLEVHGWVIDINTGLVKDLKISSNDSQNLGYVYELEIGAISGH